MSFNSRDSPDPDVTIFTKSTKFKYCIEGKRKSEHPNTNKKPSRIDKISLPTIRHLLSSGYNPITSQNTKHLRNLERLLCKQLNEPYYYLNNFIAKHRPRTPTDPNKFTNDDLDHPIFFKTSETRPGNRIKTGWTYNFRGVPRPISSRILKYKPTERIVMLSQPVRPKRRTKRWSFLSSRLSTGGGSKKSWQSSSISSDQNKDTPSTSVSRSDKSLKRNSGSICKKKRKSSMESSLKSIKKKIGWKSKRKITLKINSETRGTHGLD